MKTLQWLDELFLSRLWGDSRLCCIVLAAIPAHCVIRLQSLPRCRILFYICLCYILVCVQEAHIVQLEDTWKYSHTYKTSLGLYIWHSHIKDTITLNMLAWKGEYVEFKIDTLVSRVVLFVVSIRSLYRGSIDGSNRSTKGEHVYAPTAALALDKPLVFVLLLPEFRAVDWLMCLSIISVLFWWGVFIHVTVWALQAHVRVFWLWTQTMNTKGAVILSCKMAPWQWQVLWSFSYLIF